MNDNRQGLEFLSAKNRHSKHLVSARENLTNFDTSLSKNKTTEEKDIHRHSPKRLSSNRLNTETLALDESLGSADIKESLELN